ncbi:MAG: transglutaminase-like domain-containing protein [Symbiobacterium sp.]|uniref:transglutaminase-like domain-containing protein n=1 Tax=Symbiobacterium sp. TaxID=1971213 RepID=UPI003464B2CE
MRSEGELRALVSLLADEHEGIARTAWDALLRAGAAAVPFLEAAFDHPDPRLRGRARALLEELRLAALEERWVRYVQQEEEAMDLEHGCMLLAALGGSEGQEGKVASFLDAVAGSVRAQVPVIGGLRAMSEVLFDNLRFRGGEFGNPDHHFLPTVLEQRRGVPIALAAVYILVGRRAGLPVYGVAMPDHFLALYEQPDQPAYIDCYNNGYIYRHEALSNLLRRRGVITTGRVLAPCSIRVMLHRMLGDLERVYTRRKHERQAERVRRWRDLLVVEGMR